MVVQHAVIIAVQQCSSPSLQGVCQHLIYIFTIDIASVMENVDRRDSSRDDNTDHFYFLVDLLVTNRLFYHNFYMSSTDCSETNLSIHNFMFTSNIEYLKQFL